MYECAWINGAQHSCLCDCCLGRPCPSFSCNPSRLDCCWLQTLSCSVCGWRGAAPLCLSRETRNTISKAHPMTHDIGFAAATPAPFHYCHASGLSTANLGRSPCRRQCVQSAVHNRSELGSFLCGNGRRDFGHLPGHRLLQARFNGVSHLQEAGDQGQLLLLARLLQGGVGRAVRVAFRACAPFSRGSCVVISTAPLVAPQ